MQSRIKSTEDSWNEVPKTGSKLNGVSHLCHISPVAPPSHHVRPVTSVPSLGAAAVAILRLDGGARGQQRLDHLQVAFGSRQVQRPHASVRRAPLEMATGCARSHELLRRISEDFGSEKLGVWLPTETHTGISNMSQISLNQKTVSTGLGSHSCEPITTSSTFKPILSQESAVCVDLLQALAVHLQQASDSSDVAFFCSLQDVSASKWPKLWMSGSVWQSKVYS